MFGDCRACKKSTVTYESGVCLPCAMQMGPHAYTSIQSECCVCFTLSSMLTLQCRHDVCIECWFAISRPSFGTSEHAPKCSLCRRANLFQ